MIGYTLKPVLELVPEVLPLVKQASIEKDFPVDSRDSALASALAVNYTTRVLGKHLDSDVLEKVAKATTVYGLEEVVAEHSELMLQRSSQSLTKKASVETESDFFVKQANWQGDLSGFVDLVKVAQTAQELVEKAAVLGVNPSEDLLRYSGTLFLSKKAALGALGARFSASKKDVFVKIAAALSKEPEILPPGNLVRSLCKTVSGLDKEAGLSLRGFNFYKEALLTKEAAVSGMNVCVCGKEYPLGNVMNLPAPYVNDYLGPDFMKELQADPASAKAMVESLPRDSQHVLATLLKNAG